MLAGSVHPMKRSFFVLLVGGLLLALGVQNNFASAPPKNHAVPIFHVVGASTKGRSIVAMNAGMPQALYLQAYLEIQAAGASLRQDQISAARSEYALASGNLKKLTRLHPQWCPAAVADQWREILQGRAKLKGR
jgi:hypothetical protein